MTFDLILTHPGGSHKDEFLACCVLLAVNPAPIVRREPTPEDLDSLATCVVDVGHEHNPDRLNFDHHQFPREQTPTCSLSLILQHIGIYDEAKSYCDWLETSEWMDCRGPNETAKMLEIERSAMAKLNSPIDITLLRRFASHTELKSGNPIWEVMKMIGEDLVGFIKTLRDRISYLSENLEKWEFDITGESKTVLFLPRTEPLIDEPSMGMGRYVEANGLEDTVIATVSGDRRSVGYALSRFNDHPSVDFQILANEADVHFAHNRGFVAKTTATTPERLKELLAKGFAQ